MGKRDRDVRHKKACVIGAGPNGLSAAIVLAQAGLRVEVFEAEAQPGGGARTMELTLPGFHHDFGSAVHPMAVGSPFFNSLPLADYGLEWIYSPAPLAHPVRGWHCDHAGTKSGRRGKSIAGRWPRLAQPDGAACRRIGRHLRRIFFGRCCGFQAIRFCWQISPRMRWLQRSLLRGEDFATSVHARCSPASQRTRF